MRQACIPPAISVAGNQIGDVIIALLWPPDARRHPIITSMVKTSASATQANI